LELEQQLKRKEQECEELKRELMQYDKDVKDLNYFAMKLKQTLTEIKEIAEEQIPYLDIDNAKSLIEVEYDYAGKIWGLEQRMYKILQKISGVIPDEKA